MTDNHPELATFGMQTLDEDMESIAEKFLAQCISKERHETFDDLRRAMFYKYSKDLNLEKLPPTSSSISLHIKRAYLQTHIWLHAPFVKSISISPLEYGYEKDDDEEEDQEGVIPVVINSALPEDFPKPCKCLKCARDNTCICRAKGLKCCEYCGCKPEECKNPNL